MISAPDEIEDSQASNYQEIVNENDRNKRAANLRQERSSSGSPSNQLVMRKSATFKIFENKKAFFSKPAPTFADSQMPETQQDFVENAEMIYVDYEAA